MSQQVQRARTIGRLIGLVLLGLGVVGVAATHLWIGPKVGRVATRVHAGIVKTRAIFVEMQGWLEGIGPAIEQAKATLQQAREATAQAVVTLQALEKGHRSLAHAMEVASQDFARLPASNIFQQASKALLNSADEASRLAANVQEQSEKVGSLLEIYPSVHYAYERAHASANSLANRTTKALTLLVRMHPYRTFVAISDAIFVLLIIVGAGTFYIASALRNSESP